MRDLNRLMVAYQERGWAVCTRAEARLLIEFLINAESKFGVDAGDPDGIRIFSV